MSGSVKARGLKSAAAVDFHMLLLIISGEFVNKKSKCREKIRFQQTSQDYSSASQTPSPSTPMSQIPTYVFKNTTATSSGT